MTNTPPLRFCTWLCAALLAISHPHPSFAAGRVLVPDSGAPPSGTTPTATCALEPGPPAAFAVTWDAPGMWYSVAWRLPACAACAFPQGLEVRDVQFRVRWLAACSATATVTIVGASGDSQCPVPDTTRVLCGPVSIPITGPASTGVTYTVPMPPGCCVFEDAFVRVTFDGFLDCPDPSAGGLGPALTLSNVPCVNCNQYVQVVHWYPGMTDFCTVNDRPVWLHVDADCCAPTPAHPKSWGRVKTLYR